MSSLSSSWCSFTNLERLLQCFTPDIPKRILLQSCLNDMNHESLPIDEWSVYGAGTPLVLDSVDILTQYYIPFLSAIQIYTNKPLQSPSPRNSRDRNDEFQFESVCSSDGSGIDLYGSLSNNYCKEWGDIYFDSSTDYVLKGDILGYLNYQYIETAKPHSRVPLADKIAELAKGHPELMTLKNIDLSPASWMAVAWYPIYSIPCQQNETCFLTYHSLSSSFEDYGNKYDEIDLGKDKYCPSGWGSIIGEKLERKNNDCTSLYPFGLATYRFQEDVWLSPSYDIEKLYNLFGAAESWLKQINTPHHDFKFFRDSKN